MNTFPHKLCLHSALCTQFEEPRGGHVTSGDTLKVASVEYDGFSVKLPENYLSLVTPTHLSLILSKQQRPDLITL